MIYILVKIALLITGLIFTVRYRWFAHHATEYWFRLSRHRFPEWKFRTGFLLAGVLLILFAIQDVIVYVWVRWP